MESLDWLPISIGHRVLRIGSQGRQPPNVRTKWKEGCINNLGEKVFDTE